MFFKVLGLPVVITRHVYYYHSTDNNWHVFFLENIVKELEESLAFVHTVKDFVKVARSYPIVSLNFLKNLQLIKGDDLVNNKYVLKKYSFYIKTLILYSCIRNYVLRNVQ